MAILPVLVIAIAPYNIYLDNPDLSTTLKVGFPFIPDEAGWHVRNDGRNMHE
jgi:hypothetical protein